VPWQAGVHRTRPAQASRQVGKDRKSHEEHGWYNERQLPWKQIALDKTSEFGRDRFALWRAFAVDSQNAERWRSLKSPPGSAGRVVQQAATTGHGCLFRSVFTRRVLLGRCMLSPRRGAKGQVAEVRSWPEWRSFPSVRYRSCGPPPSSANSPQSERRRAWPPRGTALRFPSSPGSRRAHRGSSPRIA
jgi:hypothetical protein